MRLERVPMPWVRRHGLTVRWFDKWTPALDRALAELPDSTECPRDFFASLMRNPSRARKCTALVTEPDRPVAVIGLRRTGFMRWDLVGGGGVAPRFLAHSVDGYLFPALSALGMNIHVATQVEKPPEDWVQGVVSHTVFRISLASDFEAYWKASGHLDTVRLARKRTRGFEVEIDGPGAAEWTIGRWADQWRSRETASANDLVRAAEYYCSTGRMHTVRLLDGGEPVSGHNFMVEGGGLLSITTFTRPDYRQHRAGMRTLDATFEWAAAAGFDEIDLGVGHDYKRRWAPARGSRWSFDVRPLHIHAAAEVVRRTVRVARVTADATRKVFGFTFVPVTIGIGGQACMQCASY